MQAQQEKLDSISNNIANINTTGYKREDVSFRDLVYETLNRNGYPSSNDPNIASYNGTGVRTSDWIRDTSQGNLTETNLSTDLAIDGEGYFEVLLPEKNADGTPKKAYTRAGNFSLDAENNLVDSIGNRLSITYNKNVSDQDKQLTKDNFKIDDQGRIYKTDRQNNIEIGRINLYNVVGQDSLKSIGNNLYAVKTENINDIEVLVERPYPVENFSIRQGFLELSNVDVAKEMTDMIITQRAFELNSKSMKTADEMWGMANNLRSK